MTIVLRFSDYEADTFKEHLEVLEGSRFVWWGWWKKRHELYPSQLFLQLRNQLSESGIARVGLVERAEGSYLVGICDQVVTEAGKSLSAPDFDKVPEYYRAQRCPAWLRLVSIEKVALEAWRSEFGDVPLGDATVFASARSGSPEESSADSHGKVQDAAVASERGQESVVSVRERAARPATGDVDLLSASVPGRGVLHISDLHFGDDFGYSDVSLTAAVRGDLTATILNAIPCRPAVLVVSGDLTTKGQHGGLVRARLFIEALATSLGLPKEAVVITPGNHDILLEGSEVTRDMHHEQDFRDFIKLFYGPRFGLERVHVVTDSDGVGYVLGAVNSSRPRTKLTMDYGYVGSDRSEPVMRLMSRERDNLRVDRCWSVVVLHHHIVPAPLVEDLVETRPVSVSLDAGELVSLAQTFNIDAFLHGHQHLPFVGTAGRLAEFTRRGAVRTDGSEVLILGSGSTGVATRRIPEEIGQNAFSFYLPQLNGELEVSAVSFNKKLDASVLWQFSRPF